MPKLDKRKRQRADTRKQQLLIVVGVDGRSRRVTFTGKQQRNVTLRPLP